MTVVLLAEQCLTTKVTTTWPYACRLDGDDSNALILPAKRKRGQGGTTTAAPGEASKPQLSKSQQRKLRRIAEEKEKRVQRAQVGSQLILHLGSMLLRTSRQ